MILLSSLITIIGIGLLSLLFVIVRQTTLTSSLHKHRHGSEAFVDLINYAALVEEGVVVGKNGSLMAAWLYKGRDNSILTKEEMELISFRLNQAFYQMGNGWMIHVDAVRRPAPSYPNKHSSHFPDDISAAIDEERRRLFERLGTLYEGYFVITVTWFPPLLIQNKFIELMFDDETPALDKNGQTLHLLKTFTNECNNLEGRLSSVFKLERLKAYKIKQDKGITITYDNFLRWLQFCSTGINQPIRLPNNPIYLDSLIGGQDFYPGITPKIGNKYIQCVSIDGFPEKGIPGILSILCELGIEYRWSTRFIFMDYHEALSNLKTYRKKWKQKVRGFISQIFNTGSGQINEDALDMVKDLNSAIAETESGFVKQGYYTSTIVLMNEKRGKVESDAKYVAKIIAELGFNSRIETVNAVDAFLGTLPGHGVENVRRPVLNSMNLADLFPTSSIWTGETYAPSPLIPTNSPALIQCVTSSNTPFWFNLHVRDLGHALIVGPTRAGKSTLLSLIALQWRRYKDARIFCFDKGMSMYPTCKAVGGDHYVIAGENNLSFAPLQFLKTNSDRAWALEWIDITLGLNNLTTTPEQRNEIALALKSMSESGAKTISDFTMLIQDEPIREALKQYTIDGLMGNLVDAEEDNLDLSNFMAFEIEKLMRLGEKFCLPLLLYLFRRIEMSLDGKPTLILLDEVWLMLAHIVFKNKIAEWLVSFAKLNCSVVLSTQNISHLANSGILDIAIESTAVKIFLPNSNAMQKDTASLYYKMGLNENQVNIIANSQPKKDYYYLSEKGGRSFDLALGPLSLAIAGSTDKDSIEAISKLVEVHNEKWVHEWLRQKGMSLRDYAIKEAA